MRGLLLAAGQGRRFDAAGLSNKLLAHLPHDGQTVVVSAARAMLAVMPVLAVVRNLHGEVAQCLSAAGCEVVECGDADTGMSASLMCGIRAARDAAGWIIGLGDMPYVQATTIGGLLAALRDGVDIAVPVYRGRRGNPVAFSHRHLERLLALQGDRGARELLLDFPVTDIPVDDSGILRDVDTQDDLRAV